MELQLGRGLPLAARDHEQAVSGPTMAGHGDLMLSGVISDVSRHCRNGQSVSTRVGMWSKKGTDGASQTGSTGRLEDARAYRIELAVELRLNGVPPAA